MAPVAYGYGTLHNVADVYKCKMIFISFDISKKYMYDTLPCSIESYIYITFSEFTMFVIELKS